MRSTYGTASWIIAPAGNVLALSLGADSTAEHEWGSRGIATDFGYSYDATAGVSARKATRLPAEFGVKKLTVDGEKCLLLSSNLKRAVLTVKQQLRFPGFSHDTVHTACAWDSNNFAVLARGADIARLQVLHGAFTRLDVMAGGLLRLAYPVRGLVFAVASEVPSTLLDQEQALLDDELARAAILENSGVKELLKNANKAWCSLDKTMWSGDAKTTIRVWLNPANQVDNNGGWYLLDELRAWAEDKGPVVERNTSFKTSHTKDAAASS